MIKLNVKEMSCNHCVGRIDKVLSDANITHSIDLETKTVTIEEDSQVDMAIDEMDDIGFTATK